MKIIKTKYKWVMAKEKHLVKSLNKIVHIIETEMQSIEEKYRRRKDYLLVLEEIDERIAYKLFSLAIDNFFSEDEIILKKYRGSIVITNLDGIYNLNIDEDLNIKLTIKGKPEHIAESMTVHKILLDMVVENLFFD